jgi:hypothetical protein
MLGGCGARVNAALACTLRYTIFRYNIRYFSYSSISSNI